MPFTYNTIIDFPDTDAGGVVYHGRYIEIADRARSAMLRQVAGGNLTLQQEGYLFLVRKLTVDYQASAGLDAQIMVESEPVFIKGARLGLEQRIFEHQQDATLKTLAIVDIILAFVTTSGRPVRVPVWLKNKMLQAQKPDELTRSVVENA